MFGRLYEMPKAESKKRRAGELLEKFDLDEAADRTIKTYSGGMRRRLDLASALIGRPSLLFLDEPTTGPGPAQPPGHVGRHPRPRPRGHDPAADHPVPGGGRRARRHDRGRGHRARSSRRVRADELKAQVGGERIEVVVHDRDRIADGRASCCWPDCVTGRSSIDEPHPPLTAPAGRGASNWCRSCGIRRGRHRDRRHRPCADRPSTTCSCSLTGHACRGGR